MQNTQMNADFYFFSMQTGEAIYFLRASVSSALSAFPGCSR